MKNQSYSDKLKDPRWQKKRLEIMERDRFSCVFCHDKSSTLHVHHIAYFKNYEPWETPNGFLVTLCEDCHTNKVDTMIGLSSTILNYIFSIPDGLISIGRLFKLVKP